MTQRLENEELFKVVKNFHSKENYQVSSVEHPSLLPTLRPYQKEAVRWMIQRETCPVAENVLLQRVGADDETYSSNETQSLPVARLPTGGILSDEMGLGKTFEVLACILNNPRLDVVLPKPNQRKPESLEKGSKKHLSGERKATKRGKKKDDDDDEWQPNLKRTKKACSKSQSTIAEVETKTESKGTELKGKNTSRVKTLAQEWYESKLSEVKVNPIRSFRESLESSQNSSRNIIVQCICSETDEDGIMKCKSCSRWLHSKCIGALKWNAAQTVHCPQCWLKQTPVKSRATLIVSPTSISGQWLNEVKRHISKDSNFKVLAYKGVRVDGFSQPYEFSDYDLILTTYEVLRHELCLAEVHERRSLRYEKRYFTPTCPLLCVDFWRICLDEAQIVEGHATAAADMVSRFTSVHRWAVTGTPIQKSLQDLFGLIVFLCIEPYCNLQDWKAALYEPFCNGNKVPMYTLLANIMWRSSKVDVLDQIQIPQQTELLCWNDFSPVEQHFYLRTHQECSNDFIEKLSKFESLDWTLESLKVVTVNYILGPLLRLRQACSHPQAVRGNVITAQKKTMTMTELLEALIKKTVIEAQEALRKHVASLNAIAGLHIICNEFVTAAEKYREVLQIAEEYKGRVKVDTLQSIHTMHNLDEIITCHRDIVPPTLRDDSLSVEARNLQDNYLSKTQASVISAEKNLEELSEKVSLIETEFSEGNSSWWVDLCYILERKEMLMRIHDALVNHRKSLADVSSSSIINKVSTVNGVQLICNQWLEGLEKNQKAVRKGLEELKSADSMALVNAAVDCHLRISNLKSKKALCQLCAYENKLKDYETGLFDIKLKRNENTMVGDVYLLGQGKEGSWKPSEQETVLRTILSLGKQKKAESDLIKTGASFIKLMNALRKEFKPMRLLWSMINERTCAQDELNMCKLRLRLRLPDEAAPSQATSTNRRKSKPEKNQLSSNIDTKMENLHVIEIHQVETMIHQNKLEAASALSELRKKSGTVAYLQNLRSKGDSKSVVEVCPVCRNNLEKKWAVLSCGHCYCMDCITELFKKKQVLCAICRETTNFDEVSFVNPSSDDQIENEEMGDLIPSVQGSHSTKVEAIIKKLFYLKAADPSVKVLIFSTWERVLDVLEEALTQNDVKHLRLRTGPKYELTLKLFKDQEEEETVTALLLPLKLGSKGLNLTEATHVMMVEPVLNPAEELQAIGRVHRIGQMRPTFVHRFLIKDTIEERMFSAVQATGKEQWSGKQVTLRQLKDLFTSSQSVVPETQISSSTSSSLQD
ncbi:E3 ubiquitin-protein ligase SHPRH [Frankliniella fusca]|uniref:E3 ubiquitin-protein ligase SHPRH n=1 Tax=Frankliniella fusca TaxID=407009 RepID=A0AAE1LNZ6_9NEOP|nr:E3 ubiquitin-protein ligase SHPRH [Frankliniella fusca]